MWKQEEAPSSAARGDAPQRQERRVIAWVGRSVVFKGELSSSEDMTVDGRVEGTIEVKGYALTLGPDAEIRASITARRVTVHGTVYGTITAEEAVVLLETARVEGDILSPRLAVADGALVTGRVDTRGGPAADTPPAAPGPSPET
jgi:cytoskeletal protein CcmA (bactofilin family)